MNNHYRKIVTFMMMLTVVTPRVIAGEPWSFILPEQRCIQVRDPSQICRAQIPMVPKPPTILDPRFNAPPRPLSLSDVINISLTNSEVVRVLGGVSASSTGRTVYDVAITNATIDQQRGAFDPTLRLNNTWGHTDTPSAIFDALNPGQSLLRGTTNDSQALDFGLSKRMVTGGVIDFSVLSTESRIQPGALPLNPSTRSSAAVSLTQPLLQGAGTRVNKVPIVLARINTERSFFQYKDSIQTHVQSVIAGYWALVQARTDLWARQRQVEQLNFANERAQARLEIGDANRGEAAQTQLAYENFRASLITAEANVLQREAALRNVMGIPPYEEERMIPVSSLIDEKVEIDWDGILNLAESQRPDIIELKLILEADQENLLLRKNQALPTLNGVALYRWNGLEGTMPNGNNLQSGGGQFDDWNFGVNFSVPLGLRTGRALLRQQQLLIQRDRANLDQGFHAAVHTLAQNIRNLDQFFEQYKRFQAVREAARINLEQQLASFNQGNIQFIVVLQAVVDWGNAVSSEASALVQYNTELASLERETGTILEAHGIAFYEERFGAISPLGRCAQPKCYPLSTKPTPTVDRYAAGPEPSEESFNLENPVDREAAEGDIGLPELDIPDLDPEQMRPIDGGPSGAMRPSSLPVRAAKAIKNLFR